MDDRHRGNGTERNLQTEAKELRREWRERRREPARRIPFWKKTIYLFVLLFSITAIAFLLGAVEIRREVIQYALVWSNFEPDSGDEVFDLPPPPPPAPRRQVFIQGQGGAASASSFDGVLYADSDSPLGEEASGSEGGKESEAFQPPPKTEGSEEAFQELKKRSAVVEQLESGQLEGYEFLQWNPVRNDPPVFFIDLTARRLEDDREVHLVWSVDLDKREIVPLSQLAKDLSR